MCSHRTIVHIKKSLDRVIRAVHSIHSWKISASRLARKLWNIFIIFHCYLLCNWLVCNHRSRLSIKKKLIGVWTANNEKKKDSSNIDTASVDMLGPFELTWPTRPRELFSSLGDRRRLLTFTEIFPLKQMGQI